MGKDKRLKYTPIESGQDIDLSTAVTQAVILLDNAAMIAIRNSDIDSLVSVADKWIEISKLFSTDEEDEELDISDSEQYGFCMIDTEVNDGSGNESLGETVNDIESR